MSSINLPAASTYYVPQRMRLARGRGPIVDYLDRGDFSERSRFSARVTEASTASGGAGLNRVWLREANLAKSTGCGGVTGPVATSLSPVEVSGLGTSELLDRVQRRFAIRLLKNLVIRLGRCEQAIEDFVAEPAERRLTRRLSVSCLPRLPPAGSSCASILATPDWRRPSEAHAADRPFHAPLSNGWARSLAGPSSESLSDLREFFGSTAKRKSS
jgi:hypothetical protein